jgi:hypothetical protein
MRFILPFIACLLLQIATANSQTKVGVMLTLEDADDALSIRPGFGLVLDHRITRHSGFETGLFYRTFRTSGSILMSDAPNFYLLPFQVRESYISIPILYKFHSRIVNISVGPTLDFFVGWSDKTTTPDLEVSDFSVDPSFAFGAMLKISKQIRISDNLFLEPDLRMNPLVTSGRIYGGFGIAFSYLTKKD